MSASKLPPMYTVREYLAIERAAEERHEYIDGKICAMPSESGEHSDIVCSFAGTLHPQIRGTPCRVRMIATKIMSGPEHNTENISQVLLSYPDVVVICGEPKYYDEHRDIVLNPTVIVEVLSPSTEAFDRGEKFKRYQAWNPTLNDYLLVAQDQPLVDHFSRLPDGRWWYHRYVGLEASFAIPSIACRLRLADIYDRVIFAEGVAENTKTPDAANSLS